MEIRYKEFEIISRGSVDVAPEKIIKCESQEDVAKKLIELLNVKDGWEVKVTKVDLSENLSVMAKEDLTPDEVRKTHEHYCTVGRLKEFIEHHKLPDDAKIFIQRIYDVYFSNHSWGTVKKEGWNYVSTKQYIEKAKPGGAFHNRDQYPKITKKDLDNILAMEKDLDELKEEYIPTFSPVKYKDDDNLYLDAHY